MRADTQAEYIEFVRARLPWLRRVAYGLSGDWHRADDLVQATLTKTYLRWSAVRSAREVDTYVRAILVKCFLSDRRLAWSRVRLVAATPETAARPVDDAEDRAVLAGALAQLPKRQRAVIVLRFLCDLPVTEVAEILDVTDGTVKRHTSDGLASLRRYLAGGAYPMPERQS